MSSATLYHTLAELLADIPAWMAEAAHEWPLYQEVVEESLTSPAAQRALTILATLAAEPLAQRRARYDSLFNQPPRHWLYESASKTGRILGPITFEIAKLYQAAGLDSTFGAELPDHASLELAFLAHLAAQSETDPAWRELEQHFLEVHGEWLIQLGSGLARSGDAVYGPIGAFLADWLRECRDGEKVRRVESRGRPTNHRWPLIANAEDCTLCGFCVQACPTRAMAVCEDKDSTRLMLTVSRCTGCGKCLRVCDPKAITMSPDCAEVAVIPLRQSPRAVCSKCGEATVSQAEMNYLAVQLGSPAWLETCLDCRFQF